MQTETSSTRKLKKISTDIIKMTPGDEIEGKYINRTTAPWIDKTEGEEKELTRLFFERPDGSRFIVFEDAGLRNAMANAMVSTGDYVIIKKLEKVTLAGGRTCNQYDIYQVQN